MFSMENNIVGARTRLARRRMSPPLSQVDLAARLQLLGWDIGRSGIAKIETGRRQVTDIEALHLARALGVSIAWLYSEDEP